MKTAAAVLAAALCIAPAVHADETPVKLVTSYDEAVLRAVIKELGYKVGDTFIKPTGEPSMNVEMPGDLAFQIEGQFCTGKEKEQVCPGLEIATIFGDTGKVDSDVLIADVNRTYRPGKLFAFPRGFAFERYMILDGGITKENLSENIETYAEMLKAVWARMHQ